MSTTPDVATRRNENRVHHAPAAPERSTSAPQPLAGLHHVVRLALRRERFRLAIWLLGLVGLVAATGSSITSLYDTQAELEKYAQLVQDNAALIVQAGPGYGLDDPTLGAVLMNEMAIWTIIAVALMNVFAVVRHTRTEEETERAELVRAGPVGRYAATGAAMITALFANVLVATGITMTLLLYDLPTVGSVAFGATLIGAGLTFAAIGVCAAQVAGGARSALAISGTVIAGSFVLRAVGDVGSGHLSWLSPIGWAQAVRAFADERWWTLLVPLVATAVLLTLAIVVQAHRDYGGGVFEPRPGRDRAAPGFGTPVALALRLQRGTITGWTVGLALFGFFYGVVADQAESIIEDNPDMEDFFAQLGDASITDAFLATSVLMLALIGTGFTISSVLRLRSEEVSMRADTILATKISRVAWASSHVIMAAAGTVIVVGVSGAATGLGFAAMTGDAGQVPRMFVAAMVMVPALWVIGGTTMLLYSIAPRFAPAAWTFLALALFVGLFSTAINLPTWTQNLSPFQHVPALPAADFVALPVVSLLTVAVAATVIGFAALRRRDLS